MFDTQTVLDKVRDEAWPAMKAERDRVHRIDRWYRWDHDKPHLPQQSSREYRQLSDRSQAPWGRRVVTAATDQLYVEGYRSNDQAGDADSWRWWQANGMDARQIAIHDATVAYGLAYTVVLPGVDPLTGEPMPVIRGLDPSQMITFYEDPVMDSWPQYGFRVEGMRRGTETVWSARLYDADTVHYLTLDAEGKPTYDHALEHGQGVSPVVRYASRLDTRGRADGDVEPFIPLLGRIDQTTFDRLVVQRFSSFVVRTVTGMSPPDELDDENLDEWRRRTALMLKVGDLLMADDPDTSFGSLPATPLDGFISAHDADVRALAAVSQTPVHELLGQLANLSADALAAAEASLYRRIERFRHMIGEAHEQTLRLAGLAVGDRSAAVDVAAQVQWKDMGSRSLAQAADALGKLAQMLGVPVELLWEKIPGFTQQDVERAKSLVASGSSMDQLLQELMAGAAPPPEPAA